MPSRGKKRASAAAAPAVPSRITLSSETENIHSDPPEHDSPAVFDTEPKRRSTRRTASSRASSQKAIINEDIAGHSENPDQVAKMQKVRLHLGESAGKGKEDVQGSKRAVTGAMQSLEEMELGFKRDIKKRKLELEQSLVQENDGQAARAFSPGKLSRGPSDVLKVDGLLLTPERETCESGAAIDDNVWEPAMQVGEDGEEVAYDDGSGVAERGAKRSPPVNSDYLPLPWKGRLGYVSHTHIHFYLTSG